MYNAVVQAVGVVAMAFNIFSYQRKTQVQIITLQFIGSILFAVHFFMQGAYTGATLNAIGIVRAFAFMNKEKLKTDGIPWLIGFCATYAASYALTFTVFGKPFTAVNALVEILPVVGMVLTTLSFRAKTAASTRRLCLVNSPLWLAYNVVNLSVGGICCEAFGFVSIIVGILRYDRVKSGESVETKEGEVSDEKQEK